VSEPSVISSSGARNTIANDNTTITNAENGLAPLPKEDKADDSKTTDDYMAENLRDESETSEEKKLRKAREALEDTYQSIADSYDSLALAREEAFNANLAELKSTYNERKEDIAQINKMNVAVVNQAGIRSGQSRYAPTMQADIVTQEEVAGQARLKKLDTEYQNTVRSARAALEAGNYELANKKAALILDLKEKAYDEAVANAKYAQELNEKTKEKKIQASRDLAVADLLSQGVTDPAMMLDYLNKTEDGKMVGDFTAKEIKDALGNLMPERKDNYTGLTSDLKEYYTMKDMGLALPDAISSLPESQQPFAYVKYKGELERKATEGDKTKSFEFNNVQRGELIGTGLSNDVVTHIQEGLRDGYGLNEIMASETGLTDAQRIKITNIVSGISTGNQFLNTKSIKQTFSDDVLRKAANEAGYTEGGKFFSRDYGVGDEALDTYIEEKLMSSVQLYRDMGLTDKEILAKMEDKFSE